MSRLLDFYRGQATDAEGRLLKEIWTWDDDDLEAVHDFIQWLFPLPEPSQFNPDAPLLTEEDIDAFKNDPILRANVMKSFERILAFLGFSLAEDGKVVEGDNFPARIVRGVGHAQPQLAPHYPNSSEPDAAGDGSVRQSTL